MTISSPTSRLQSLLTADGLREPNFLNGTRAARTIGVTLTQDITLDQPITVYHNSGLGGDRETRRTITYMGTSPPIKFSTHDTTFPGGSANIYLKNLTIYCPNAAYPWEWDTTAHTGNAHNYVFENLSLYAATAHCNCLAPGDNRMYGPTFRNIDCFGPGQTVVGVPVIALFEKVRVVNTSLIGYAIDITSPSECRFMSCWIEPGTLGILKMRGSFAHVTWDSYSEPTHSGVMFDIDGSFANLTAASPLLFVDPDHTVRVTGGARVEYPGLPDVTSTGGVHANILSYSDSSHPNYAATQALLAQAFQVDSTSAVFYNGGDGTKRMITGTI